MGRALTRTEDSFNVWTLSRLDLSTQTDDHRQHHENHLCARTHVTTLTPAVKKRIDDHLLLTARLRQEADRTLYLRGGRMGTEGLGHQIELMMITPHSPLVH